MSLKIAIILVFILPLTACTSTPKQPTAGVKVFTVPPPPAILTSPEQKAEFIATHYWDNFDFADTTLISRANITEQAFADFISLLAGGAPRSIIEKSIDTMMTRATADSTMYAHFVELSEKYLYDPNSPYRNENIYISVLRNIIANEQLDDIYKIRPRYQLESAMKNRPGTKAANFAYTTGARTQGSLWQVQGEYTLLMFYNPDCSDCARVEKHIEHSEALSALIASSRMAVIAIYPDNDMKAWRKHLPQMPEGWTVGCDPSQQITNNGLYDLPAIPNLYLLDRNKRVIFKDAPIEQIEQYMTDK